MKKALGQSVYELIGTGSKQRQVLSSESFFYYIPVLDTLNYWEKMFLSMLVIVPIEMGDY